MFARGGGHWACAGNERLRTIRQRDCHRTGAASRALFGAAVAIAIHPDARRNERSRAAPSSVMRGACVARGRTLSGPAIIRPDNQRRGEH